MMQNDIDSDAVNELPKLVILKFDCNLFIFRLSFSLGESDIMK